MYASKLYLGFYSVAKQKPCKDTDMIFWFEFHSFYAETVKDDSAPVTKTVNSLLMRSKVFSGCGRC